MNKRTSVQDLGTLSMTIKDMDLEIFEADVAAERAMPDDGRRPSERLFSIALSRKYGRPVRFSFSADNTESYIEEIPGH